ncbi:MAG: TetR/AcrR family transcriptional regulator [Lachnospiraceae bacterium]|nr:TetR/AcrR family transcriptional regulator [Lachnospiraceae bacterium]
MNTKGNQRYQDTRKRIKAVVQDLLQTKKLQEITVSEVCRLAGIHRTTFYGHFLDIYDCMEKLIREMYTEMMEHFVAEENVTLSEGFLWLFEFVKEHRGLFLRFIEIRQESPTFQGLPTFLERHMEKLVLQFGYISKEELLYHQEFFSAGLLAMIRRWLLCGCVESPEEMCRILERAYVPEKEGRYGRSIGLLS